MEFTCIPLVDPEKLEEVEQMGPKDLDLVGALEPPVISSSPVSR
jgi:hypothetical protein